METYPEPKPLVTAKFEPIRALRYLDDEGIFEVEFESGETLLSRLLDFDLTEAQGVRDD